MCIKSLSNLLNILPNHRPWKCYVPFVWLVWGLGGVGPHPPQSHHLGLTINLHTNTPVTTSTSTLLLGQTASLPPASTTHVLTSLSSTLHGTFTAKHCVSAGLSQKLRLQMFNQHIVPLKQHADTKGNALDFMIICLHVQDNENHF